MCACVGAQSSPSVCDLWTVAHQGPLSMGFSRQEYWSDLLFPSLGDLPDPGIEPTSLASPALAGRFSTAERPRKPFKRASGCVSVCKVSFQRFCGFCMRPEGGRLGSKTA